MNCPAFWLGNFPCCLTDHHPGPHRFERDGRFWEWNNLGQGIIAGGKIDGWEDYPTGEWQ